MEIIHISNYTLEEKQEIAKRYLIPKQIEENGLSKSNIKISPKAVEKIIDEYTRESGVRNLEREIGTICRGVAAKVASEETDKESIGISDIEDYLGKQRFYKETVERLTVPGVSTGLAWTPFGGDILFIEASLSKGNGKLNITGQLGDVMKESAMLAVSYLRSKADDMGIPQNAFTEWDLHIHVPAGAVPKDGPSAGVALFSAITSIYTQRKVKSTLAMTGEITLRGQVLPVGGIKEKVLAAKRAGIECVLLPKRNLKDFEEIDKNVIGDLDVIYLERIEELLEIVLEDETLNDPYKMFKSSKKDSKKDN